MTRQKNSRKYIRRPLGQILIDGGFLSTSDLELVLEEQKRTNELLGEALVRMGIVDQLDIKAALSVQGYLHLGRLEDAVRVAAGVRRKLGELLVRSGRITESQLKYALAEQKRNGEKLGQVLIRLGLLTEEQLNGLLVFQRFQGEAMPSPGPLRLGELLVSMGCITRLQLDKALDKQTFSRKKLGEVLIEEGYAEPRHVKHGMRLQEMLLAAALAALLTACGSDRLADNPSVPNPTPATTTEQVPSYSSNYFEISGADYDILKPNYYYTTNNDKFWSIQAAVAKDVWDEEYRCVVRIDIQKSIAGEMPVINKTFSIGEDPNYERFPGAFIVFNGEKSVSKKVEQGLLSFTEDSTASGTVRGSFEVILTDYDSASVPPPQHRLTGSFNFNMGTYGPASPLPVS
jgi:hypothetical protein